MFWITLRTTNFFYFFLRDDKLSFTPLIILQKKHVTPKHPGSSYRVSKLIQLGDDYLISWGSTYVPNCLVATQSS